MNDMNLNMDPEKLEKLIVQEAVDQILAAPDQDEDRYGRMLSDIRKGVNDRIDKIFADRADALIQDALDEAIKGGFEREYNKVNQWGQREDAGVTSISKELERLVTSYWSEAVDRNGKPTSSDYNRITRAEYLMTQICAEDFSKAMKESAVQITGALKDGMRNQLATHTDQLLNNLFKVKSLQDQGKVEKPF
jgi:hypothetical protein